MGLCSWTDLTDLRGHYRSVVASIRVGIDDGNN